jgi:aspartate/methionine/tyrosine aminotransferase
MVPAPSYPLFDALGTLQSVAVDRYPLEYDGAWHLDAHRLASRMTARTRAVLTVHPNNPTGSFVKRAERAALDDIAASRNVAIVSDEVFAETAFAPDATREPTFATDRGALTFTMSGLSKLAGLPQMKLAWIVVSGPRPLVDAALTRLEWIADTYLSVSTPVQHAAPSWLATRALVGDAIGRRVRGNLERLRERLASDHTGPCSLLHLEGGWYATLRVPATLTEDAWALTLLDRDGVLVQPGYFFEFAHEAFLVISLLTPPSRFAAGVERLLARVHAES